MKKIFIALLIVGMLFGCSSQSGDEDLKSILNDISVDADNPDTEEIELDKDNFESYAFISYQEGYKGIASEALINAIAHSVVLISVNDGSDTASLAQDIFENADSCKWICTEAEKTAVCYTDDLIILIMSFEDTTDKMVENFKNKYSSGQVLEKSNFDFE